jgi:hypothetical protein
VSPDAVELRGGFAPPDAPAVERGGGDVSLAASNPPQAIPGPQ